jgi:hypothetical protein
VVCDQAIAWVSITDTGYMDLGPMEEKDMVYVFQVAVFILWHWEIKKTWLTKTTWSKTAQAAGAS